jgi:DNA-binding NarL/FixJ family response regulator
MVEQAAVVMLNSEYVPLYVSTEAARILLHPKQSPPMASAAKAIAGAVRDLIAGGSPQGDSGRFGYLNTGGRSYLWNITRCDEWTAHETPWNYVLMLRRAELPEAKIKTICQQFHLSPRQEETLTYLFQGLTSKEIAGFLNLSPHTVKIHIRALMTKLQVTTRTALVGRVLAASERPLLAESAPAGDGVVEAVSRQSQSR